jgi:hypothetical protein
MLLVTDDLSALGSPEATARGTDASLARAWMLLEQQVPSERRRDVSLLMSLTMSADDTARGRDGRVREFLAEEPFASAQTRLREHLAAQDCEVER